MPSKNRSWIRSKGKKTQLFLSCSFLVSRPLLGYTFSPSLPGIHQKTFLLTLTGNGEFLHFSPMTRIPFDPGGEVSKILMLGKCRKVKSFCHKYDERGGGGGCKWMYDCYQSLPFSYCCFLLCLVKLCLGFGVLYEGRKREGGATGEWVSGLVEESWCKKS